MESTSDFFQATQELTLCVNASSNCCKRDTDQRVTFMHSQKIFDGHSLRQVRFEEVGSVWLWV